MLINKRIKKAHVRQLDQSDCGVACLAAALQYAGGYVPLERIREISGTSSQGTTLLGLRDAANQLGFAAEGFQCDLKSLQECEDLTILHTIKDQRFQHYVLCYGYDKASQEFLISDPGEPHLERWSQEEVLSVWKSGALLKLEATGSIEPRSSLSKAKMGWAKALLEDDANLLLTAGGIGVIIAGLGLSTAIFSQKLIDFIIPKEDTTTLVLGMALLSILLLARSGLSYFRQLFILQQGKNFNVRVMDFFLGRLLRLPKSFFDNRKTGELIARMNDTRRIQAAIAKIISGVMIDLLLIVVATIAIFVYDWKIGLVALCWVPIFTVVVRKYHQAILSGQREVMRNYAHNESFFVDTMLGVGTIKTSNKEAAFQRLGLNVYNRFQDTTLSLGKVSIGFNAAVEIVGSIFLVVILGWSAYSVMGADLSTGSLIAILQLIAILMGSAAQLAIVNIQLQEARVAFDRMYDFAAIPPEMGLEQEEQEVNQGLDLPTLEELIVKNISFRYPGSGLLLKGINLTVRKGQWVSILGESGCGKSTLLNILQRFYDYEAGQILVNNQEIRKFSIDRWRDQIGVVPQNIKIFNGSVLYNILLETEIGSSDEIIDFLKKYGFLNIFNKFPQGLNTLVGEEGVNLSGGQMQLVALARALYHDPVLLLLDEPTSALDRDTEDFVLNLLRSLQEEGKAIIVLTHRIRTAKAADQIFIIERGQVVENGHHLTLMNKDNLYGRAWQDLTSAAGGH